MKNTPFDQRIGETSAVIARIVRADPWEPGSIWGELDSGLLLDVKGW